MVGLGIDLWSRRGQAAGEAPFASPNGLVYFRNDGSEYFANTGATVPATHEGDAVAAWKNASGEIALQNTAGNRPTLNLSVAAFGGRPGLLFVDDQGSPTVAKFLDLSGVVNSTYNSGAHAFAQTARNAGLGDLGYILSVVSATDPFRLREGNNIRYGITANYGSLQFETEDDDVGIQSLRWDGTYLAMGWNNHEIGFMQNDPSAGPGFANGDVLRIGNYDGAASNSARWLGMVCRPTKGNLSSAQARAERIELGRVTPLPNSGKGKILLTVVSNSIGAGFGGQTPWPSQLSTLWGPAAHWVFNRSTVSATPATLKDDAFNAGGARMKGNFYASILYKQSGGSPGRTAFDCLKNFNGASPGWSTDEWAGWGVVFESGANKGYGAYVSSNDADTLTLASPGLPYAPSANDTFRLVKPGEQLDTCFGVVHEMRNDLWINGATEGPAAAGGSKENCLVYQRDVCLKRAMKLYGYRMIELETFDDSGSNYSEYQSDLTTVRGWRQADSEAIYDAYVGSDEVPEIADASNGTYFIDGLHPSTALHALIASAIRTAVDGLG